MRCVPDILSSEFIFDKIIIRINLISRSVLEMITRIREDIFIYTFYNSNAVLSSPKLLNFICVKRQTRDEISQPLRAENFRKRSHKEYLL